jgi:hypothetical protein
VVKCLFTVLAEEIPPIPCASRPARHQLAVQSRSLADTTTGGYDGSIRESATGESTGMALTFLNANPTRPGNIRSSPSDRAATSTGC